MRGLALVAAALAGLATAMSADGARPAAPRVCFLDLDSLARHCATRPVAAALR
jgi:hypothetical protein